MTLTHRQQLWHLRLYPDADADGYTAYADITEAQAIGWVKADVDADAVEASIAAQIADSKAPAISTGVPW